MIRSIFTLFLFCIAITLCSCSKNKFINGYSFGDLGDVSTKISSIIKPGISNEIEVLNLLGSPTVVSNFGPYTFFYITAKSEQKAFFKPKLVEQRIVEIIFDNNHTVVDLKEYDLNNHKLLKYENYEMPIEGKKLNILEQFMLNLGRFNDAKGNR